MKKRANFKEWLTKHHPGIAFLQETHIDSNTLKAWQQEWPYSIYISGGNTKSKGVATLIPEHLDHNIRWQYSDAHGRLLILGTTINGFDCILGNCYFPTKDNELQQLETLQELKEILITHIDEPMIIAGDFNIVILTLISRAGLMLQQNQTNYRPQLIAN